MVIVQQREDRIGSAGAGPGGRGVDSGKGPRCPRHLNQGRARVDGVLGVVGDVAIHAQVPERFRARRLQLAVLLYQFGHGQVEQAVRVDGAVVHAEPQVVAAHALAVRDSMKQGDAALIVHQRNPWGNCATGNAHDPRLIAAIEEILLDGIAQIAGRGQSAKLALKVAEVKDLCGFVGWTALCVADEPSNRRGDPGNRMHSARNLFNINSGESGCNGHGASFSGFCPSPPARQGVTIRYETALNLYLFTTKLLVSCDCFHFDASVAAAGKSARRNGSALACDASTSMTKARRKESSATTMRLRLRRETRIPSRPDIAPSAISTRWPLFTYSLGSVRP